MEEEVAEAGEEFFITEQEFSDLQSVNKELKNKKFIILCINIRSLNKNGLKLEVFIDRLINKPQVIVCTEIWKKI